jgi:hypothetical protein
MIFFLCVEKLAKISKMAKKKEKKKLGLMNAYQSKRQPELSNIYKVVVHRSVHGTVDEVQSTV